MHKSIDVNVCRIHVIIKVRGDVDGHTFTSVLVVRRLTTPTYVYDYDTPAFNTVDSATVKFDLLSVICNDKFVVNISVNTHLVSCTRSGNCLRD